MPWQSRNAKYKLQKGPRYYVVYGVLTKQKYNSMTRETQVVPFLCATHLWLIEAGAQSQSRFVKYYWGNKMEGLKQKTNDECVKNPENETLN